MAGLLGQSPLAGLLAMVQQPQPIAADEGDMLLANRYEQRQAALPQIPRRGPPSAIGNAFRFLAGGQEGLAADRAARLAEANAPALAEQKQRLADMVAQMAPQAQLAYALNPEKFGESLSEQFRPQVIGKGGVQSVIGENRTVSAPGFEQRGKTLYREDPINGVEAVLDIAPTYAEDTAAQNAATSRMNAETNLEYGTQRTASPGVQVLDRFGNVVGENTNQTPQQVAAQQKRDDERVKAAASLESINAKVEDTGRAVDTALSQVGNWTAGLGSSLAVVPGTPAADLKSTIDTIEANLSFNALAEMRANSPTGGALGGIAVRELELLGATVASLRQSQSPEQLRRNLGTIKTSLTRLKNAQEQAYQQRFAGSSAPSGGPQVGAIEDGYRFLGGNPSNPASWERVN